MVRHPAGATKVPQVPPGKMLRPPISVKPAGPVCLCYRIIGRLKFVLPLQSGLLVLAQHSSYFGVVNGCRCAQDCWSSSSRRKDCKVPLEAARSEERLSFDWYPVISVIFLQLPFMLRIAVLGDDRPTDADVTALFLFAYKRIERLPKCQERSIYASMAAL